MVKGAVDSVLGVLQLACSSTLLERLQQMLDLLQNHSLETTLNDNNNVEIVLQGTQELEVLRIPFQALACNQFACTFSIYAGRFESWLGGIGMSRRLWTC